MTEDGFSLDSKGQYRFVPDLVTYERATNQVRCILDTKYKVVDKPSDDDIAQVIAYAFMKQSPEAVLVYPVQPKVPLDAPNNGIRVRSVSFDLDKDLGQAGQKFLADLGLADGSSSGLRPAAQGVDMKVYTVNGHDYHLPGGLNDFQLQMYVHLINWKWQHLTREPGVDAKGNVYDAWLPPAFVADYRILYPPIVETVQHHLTQYPFHVHPHFHHMASSQAANFNLFLPILLNPRAADVLRQVKPDFAHLATEELDHGFRVEFKDKPHTAAGDTPVIAHADADIAIAYYSDAGELCLWLIEHKLTEKEFTTCGGYDAAKGSPTHDCSKSIEEIIAAPELCYYTYPCGYRYWEATQQQASFFAHPAPGGGCPFRGGMNQLWRNQLLAFSVEGSQAWAPYKHAFFSVVVHPDNRALDKMIAAYKSLIADNPDPARHKFPTFTSADFVRAAAALDDGELNRWVGWYSGLYHVEQG